MPGFGEGHKPPEEKLMMLRRGVAHIMDLYVGWLPRSVQDLLSAIVSDLEEIENDIRDNKLDQKEQDTLQERE